MLKSSSSINVPSTAAYLESTRRSPFNLHSKLAIFALKTFVSIILLYYYDDLTTTTFASFTIQEISQTKEDSSTTTRFTQSSFIFQPKSATTFGPTIFSTFCFTTNNEFSFGFIILLANFIGNVIRIWDQRAPCALPGKLHHYHSGRGGGQYWYPIAFFSLMFRMMDGNVKRASCIRAEAAILMYLCTRQLNIFPLSGMELSGGALRT